MSGRPRPQKRHGTSTSAFGVSRREAHDSSAFYERFTSPVLDGDTDVAAAPGRRAIDEVFCHDARSMPEIDDRSVALVVTSPPYFAGKEYEAALGQGGTPTTYAAYLEMLEDVFRECVRKLEPGGRIAVNVANLGRRPYRSLSADVAWILQDRLRLLLRGEIIWVKARGSSGSCAWGSFQRPANPVLRDLTERVVVAGKGRFDRAVTARERHAGQLPSEASISRDEFMEATTDLWEIPSESATRVDHPAPFPVELPERLIQLYTYRDDLVLDPFMGSGATGVAAVRSERHFAGYDTDEGYVLQAKRRVEAERERLEGSGGGEPDPPRVALAARPGPPPVTEDLRGRAVREGRAARDLARQALEGCDLVSLDQDVTLPHAVEVSFVARGPKGGSWHLDVCGGFTTSRPGLRRADTLWKAVGKAAVLAQACPEVPFVLLTTGLPTRGSSGDRALRAVLGEGRPIRDVILLSSDGDLSRLREILSVG